MDIQQIEDFVRGNHTSGEIPALMQDQDRAGGYAAYIGSLVNALEEKLSNEEANALSEVMHDEELTETVRKVRIKAKTAGTKRAYQDMKLLYHRLIQVERKLAQAIKTIRESPR